MANKGHISDKIIIFRYAGVFFLGGGRSRDRTNQSSGM